ncbi:SIMPL domain-containing protein [Wielerella bovis]|uniref:SIMPL domain-containing protein n=1 Tax=Wielerella bovis TaxID=2917790 RepID=UPI00201841B1|nr:SIMPL domain-containing protein [Wielerella bovis]ULJ69998.1 SIMPL domain-containing protein [Wielerella bovis]
MMKKIGIAMLLMGVFTTPVAAEELHYNVLSFRESASFSVDNDTMNIVLRVMETGKSRVEVSNRVSRRVNAVLARARSNKTFEVESGNRSVYPEYNDKRVITSWTDTAEIRVKSTDFDALSKLAADSQNDAMLDNVYFSVSPKKHEDAVNQASEQALQAFRLRAQNMSRSLGFSAYKIVRVDLNQSFENSESVMMAAPMTASMRNMSAKYQATDVMQTSAGKREIRQTVNATVQMY